MGGSRERRGAGLPPLPGHIPATYLCTLPNTLPYMFCILVSIQIGKKLIILNQEKYLNKPGFFFWILVLFVHPPHEV